MHRLIAILISYIPHANFIIALIMRLSGGGGIRNIFIDIDSTNLRLFFFCTC